MGTFFNIDNRLTEFSVFGNNVVQDIIAIINDNFKENNVSKGKRGNTPIITFVDSEFENVFLHIQCIDFKPVATIDIEDSEYPVQIKINLDYNFFETIPQEIADYLQE